MECRGKSRLIGLYIDDMLPNETKQALERHIDTCSVCNDILSSYTLMRDVMRHLYREDPVNVKPRVLHAVMMPRKIMKGMFTAAAMLLLLIGGYFVGSYQPLQRTPAITHQENEDVYKESAQISSNTSENVKVRYENVSF